MHTLYIYVIHFTPTVFSLPKSIRRGYHRVLEGTCSKILNFGLSFSFMGESNNTSWIAPALIRQSFPLQNNKIKIYYRFQIFNIYTANGSVISSGGTSQGSSSATAAGSQTSLTGQTTQTGQAGVNASISVAQTGVSGASVAGGGYVAGSIVPQVSLQYTFAPVGYDVHIYARQKMFLDARGFANVSK